MISNKNVCLERYTRVGKSSLIVKDKSMLERLKDIAALLNTKRLVLFNVPDAYIRDFKTSRAYAK